MDESRGFPRNTRWQPAATDGDIHLSHPPELKNYPDAIVKDCGERLSSALMTAHIRKSMGGLGGGKVYDLCDFDQEMRPFIEAYLQGDHDSTALVYAAMKTKEQELTQQSDAAKVATAKAPARAPDYVIEMDAIGGPCWVATGGGDPERTHDLSKAEIYATEPEARENAYAFASRYQSRKFRVRLKSEAEALQLMQGDRSQTQTVSPTAPTGLSSQAQSTIGRWVNEHMERAVANGGMPEELVEIAVWLHELNKHEGCAPAATATHPAEAPIAEQPLYERPRA